MKNSIIVIVALVIGGFLGYSAGSMGGGSSMSNADMKDVAKMEKDSGQSMIEMSKMVKDMGMMMQTSGQKYSDAGLVEKGKDLVVLGEQQDKDGAKMIKHGEDTLKEAMK